MACAACSHTVSGLGNGWFWCERCGSLKGPDGCWTEPFLVQRCRDYEKTIVSRAFHEAINRDVTVHIQEWNSTGIRESINPPERRPPE